MRNASASRYLLVAVGFALALVTSLPIAAQEPEPIAAVGHGGFFDQEGRQIPLTLEFATRAQAWYRARLVENLTAAKRRDFDGYDRRLKAGLNMTGQDALALEHQSLEWLLANITSTDLKLQSAGKLRALRQAMEWRLPAKADLAVPERREPFTPNAQILQRLQLREFRVPQARNQPPAEADAMVARPVAQHSSHSYDPVARRSALPPFAMRLPTAPWSPSPSASATEERSVTTSAGQAYINECLAAGIPIPPAINLMDPAGVAGWRSQGFIPTSTQFIVGTPAEVRTFHKTTSPDGMCIALPRYTDSTRTNVLLDGVICMGRQSSKVCFWDNQWTNPATGNVEAFTFPAGTQIPIGVPSTPDGKYQAGGKEIEFGPGGVCTDCHAGENPYIIHPRANLAETGPAVLWQSLSGAPQNLPTMAVNRYDPLVAATWPQNQLSQAEPTVPGECSACHTKGGAGRFPHLSNNLSSYCNTILTQAISRTMPPGSPGSASAVATAFKNAWCGGPPSPTSADAGDPHITTTNGVRYDFQSAGEFTALKNSDTGFELQTRQTPVLTSFTPGPNPYTGLASCVSLNTAVALRLGKQRVTLQFLGPANSKEPPQLRVDGKPITVRERLDLGGGNAIMRAARSGEVDVRSADGTRVVVIPLFWASQGYWYLDVQVFNTPAREGVMSHVLGADWLPRAPDGTSFGPRPAGLPDRHAVLNQKFADAWRVTGSTSLFDYAAGTSTADFTDRNWPTEVGKACNATTVSGFVPTVKEPRPDLAQRACRGIRDKNVLLDCIFDVTVMGDPIAARGHLRADALRR